MSAARVNSKAIYLPDLEEPMPATARETRTSRLIADWIDHTDTVVGGDRLAQLSRKVQWGIVLIGVLAALRTLH